MQHKSSNGSRFREKKDFEILKETKRALVNSHNVLLPQHVRQKVFPPPGVPHYNLGGTLNFAPAYILEKHTLDGPYQPILTHFFAGICWVFTDSHVKRVAQFAKEKELSLDLW